MIPLYILGILQRYGPQHGYQIKKNIAEQLSDFTQIKLPTIYYHLEKMETEGLLSSSSEKPSLRPEKTTYSITSKGLEAFKSKLAGFLEFDYRPTFSSDSVFFFSEHLERENIREQLTEYIERPEAALKSIEGHEKESMQFVPEDMRKMAAIIFSHHRHHYQAEFEWARESIENLS